MASTEGVRHRRPESSDAAQGGERPALPRRQRKLKKQGVLTNCWNVMSKVVGVSILIVLAFVIMITLKSSPVQPVAFELPPPRPWTGPLAPNNKLQQAQKILEGKVIGPESLAYRNGRIYTGTYEGKVIEISNERDIKVVAELGTPPCGTREDEMRCGRPLGVRFVGDKLMVMDSYFGLYEVDLTGNSLPFELVSTQRSYNGHRMKFANDFEKLENGDFIFTDSSYRKYRKDYGMLALESQGDGRLLWYNPVTKMSDQALDNLHFPNGVQLSPKKDFLLISETSRYRILKYYLSGPKTGSTEVFIDNLPGMPDNIRPSSNGGYWVGIAMVNTRRGPLTMDFLAPLPWLRSAIAKVVDVTALQAYLPQYGLIIELNQKGEIVQSLHDPTGKVAPSVSEVLDTGDALYLGSYHAPYLLKLKI